MDDGGLWYRNDYGPDWETAYNSFTTYRKEFPVGQDGWLTASLSARDRDKDGVIEAPPSIRTALQGDTHVAVLDVPDHTGGAIFPPTEALPPRYRVEYKLTTFDFGGRRHGTLEYEGRINGYDAEGCKTQHPWGEGSNSPGWRGDASEPYCKWQDVRAGPDGYNGFHFLAIVDVADPAPRNNHFWHYRRKVPVPARGLRRRRLQRGTGPGAPAEPVCARRRRYGIAGERRGPLGGQRLQARSGVAREQLDRRNPARAVRPALFRPLVGVDRHQRLAPDQHGNGHAGAVLWQRREHGRAILRALLGTADHPHAASLVDCPPGDAGVRRRQNSLRLCGRRIESDQAPAPQPFVRCYEQRSPARFRGGQIGQRVQHTAQRGLLVQTAHRIEQPRHDTQRGLLARHRHRGGDRLRVLGHRLPALAGPQGFTLGLGLSPHLVGTRGQLLRQVAHFHRHRVLQARDEYLNHILDAARSGHA